MNTAIKQYNVNDSIVVGKYTWTVVELFPISDVTKQASPTLAQQMTVSRLLRGNRIEAALVYVFECGTKRIACKCSGEA